MDIIDIIEKLSVLVLMTPYVNMQGFCALKKTVEKNIYEYYCDSINQTNLMFTKTYKSDTTYRHIAHRKETELSEQILRKGASNINLNTKASVTIHL